MARKMTEAQREALAKAHDAQREAQRSADIALYTQAAERLTAEDRDWLRETIAAAKPLPYEGDFANDGARVKRAIVGGHHCRTEEIAVRTGLIREGATIDMIMAAAPTNVAELVLHIGINNL